MPYTVLPWPNEEQWLAPCISVLHCPPVLQSAFFFLFQCYHLSGCWLLGEPTTLQLENIGAGGVPLHQLQHLTICHTAGATWNFFFTLFPLWCQHGATLAWKWTAWKSGMWKRGNRGYPLSLHSENTRAAALFAFQHPQFRYLVAFITSFADDVDLMCV